MKCKRNKSKELGEHIFKNITERKIKGKLITTNTHTHTHANEQGEKGKRSFRDCLESHWDSIEKCGNKKKNLQNPNVGYQINK